MSAALTVAISAALHPGQAAIYNSTARFKVVAAGRRFGKSHYAALDLIQAAMMQELPAGPYRSRSYPLTVENGVYYVAPTFDQAKRVMWPKLRQLAGYAGKRNKRHPDGGLIVNENINDGWLELVSGRRIYIKGADEPDRLRGTGYALVVLDEYADMKPTTWDDIIEPALMDVEGEALFIGTPRGKNHFWKLFIGATEKPPDPETGNNKHWDGWESFHFKSTDNPYLSKRELDRQMNNPRKSRDTIRQELEASFVSGGSKHLKSSDFKIVKGLPREVNGSVLVTVDLAGFKKEERGKKVLKTDESVIVITFTDREKWYVKDILHGHWGTRETALNIVTTLRKYPGARLGVEAGALANAIAEPLDEYMREFNRYVTPEPLHHNNAAKYDRIVWSLQGRSQRGLIHLVEGLGARPEWIAWLMDQADDFPDPLSHDDGLDALAYVDQMATAVFVDTDDLPEPEILDELTQY